MSGKRECTTIPVMDRSSHRIALPARIRTYIVDLIDTRLSGEERDRRRLTDALPQSLAAGEVERLFSGGPFGWMMDARLDEIDGRVALEVLEDNRMSGPEHYRVWEDGTREELETEETMMVLPENCSPEEARRIEEAHHAHNRAVAELLRQRGFLRDSG